MIVRTGLSLIALGVTGLAVLLCAAVWRGEPTSFADRLWFAWSSEAVSCGATKTCSYGDYVHIASESPLDAKPYALLMRRELERDQPLALRAAGQLFLRNPRSVDARVVLANDALRSDDLERFADLYFPLFDIMSHDQRRFVEPLVQLSGDVRVFAAVKQRLQNAPAWGNEFLLAFLGTEDPPFADLAPIIDRYPHLRGHFLSSMIRHDQSEAAYANFVSTLSSAEIGLLGIPFNSAMVPSVAPRPFNWRLVSQNAEFLEDAGIFVYYQNERREDFFRQLFPLNAGTYSLSVELDGETSKASGHFMIEIRCHEGGDPLLTMTLNHLTEDRTSFHEDFEVPADGCRFQRLTFSGVPGVLTKQARAFVRRIAIDGREA